MKIMISIVASLLIASTITSCGNAESKPNKEKSESAATTTATVTENTTTVTTTDAPNTTTVTTTTAETTTTEAEDSIVDGISQIENDWSGTLYQEQFKNITYYVPKNYSYEDYDDIPTYYYDGGMIALTLNEAFGQIDDDSISQIIEVLKNSASGQDISDYYVDDNFLVIKATGLTGDNKMTYMRHIAASVGDSLLFFHIYDTESEEHLQAVFDKFYEKIEYEQPEITKKSSNTLIFENQDLKIYYKGFDLEASRSGPEIKLLIENNSSINYTIQIDSCTIDNFMIDTIMSDDVKAGKKNNCDFTLKTRSLEENGINPKDIKEIEVCFRTFDTDTWDIFSVTTPIIIKL